MIQKSCKNWKQDFDIKVLKHSLKMEIKEYLLYKNYKKILELEFFLWFIFLQDQLQDWFRKNMIWW